MSKGADFRQKIEDIRALYLLGKLTLDEAKEKALPLLDEMNAIGKKIAKQHGKKFKPLTFGYIIR